MQLIALVVNMWDLFQSNSAPSTSETRLTPAGLGTPRILLLDSEFQIESGMTDEGLATRLRSVTILNLQYQNRMKMWQYAWKLTKLGYGA